MNRHIQFVKESEALFAAISSLFSQCRVYRICIVLGASLQSARELCHVTFQDRSIVAQTDPEFDHEQNLDIVARSMLRQLIRTYSEAILGSAQRSTMFLLAQCDRHRCPDGFVPKHSLRVRPRKDAVQLHFRFSCDEACANASSRLDADSSDRLWFQSCVAIKGLRGVVIPS